MPSGRYLYHAAVAGVAVHKLHGGIVSIYHQDLSHMMGASRQSISKELKLLEHEGDRQMRYSKIYFRDLALLAEKCEQSVGLKQFAPIHDEGD